MTSVYLHYVRKTKGTCPMCSTTYFLMQKSQRRTLWSPCWLWVHTQNFEFWVTQSLMWMIVWLFCNHFNQCIVRCNNSWDIIKHLYFICDSSPLIWLKCLSLTSLCRISCVDETPLWRTSSWPSSQNSHSSARPLMPRWHCGRGRFSSLLTFPHTSCDTIRWNPSSYLPLTCTDISSALRTCR